jgi:hypothetical protein
MHSEDLPIHGLLNNGWLFRGDRNMTRWRELGTQIAPRGWIFWTMIFYNLKNS